MREMAFLELVKAEGKVIMIETFRRKSMLFAMFFWPYFLTFFMVFLGSIFGSAQAFQARTGGDPISYFMASSVILMISLTIMDDIGSRMLWESWLGTLPYIMASPVRRVEFLLALPLPRAILAILWALIGLGPVVLLLKGLESGLGLLLAVFFAILGAVGLAGFALVVGGLMLYFREEWSIAQIIRPLMLLVSGVYYPVYLMPMWLRFIASFIPLTHAVEATRLSVMFEQPPFNVLFTLMGLILVLTALYTPMGVKVYGFFERKALKEGIKT